ncbi:YdaS family helix-turn-helix protein [Rhodopseudomonas sp. RCAM05734]|uniref:YdaS family helix-turn-helix protein n=1 Tax=Rhodopseudomonas sp. RCAM05734 TaxID=3457549 RepID=UPI004044C67C
MLLEEAIFYFDGSESKLARAAGFSQNAVWHARRVGRVSGDLAAGIDRATKGRVSIRRTRPDLLGAVSSQGSLPFGDASESEIPSPTTDRITSSAPKPERLA